MFDIGWSELLVIGIVALIVIGPKELPGVLRTVGQYMAKVRRMAAEFQGQFQEAMREAEMADLKKQVDEMSAAASEMTHFDPMASVQKDIDAAFSDQPAEPATSPPEGTASASPEAVAAEAPAPVSPDFAIPQPANGSERADLAVAPEAPQPKAGSGA